MYIPSEDPTKEGGVEALGRGEAALDLGYGHLVLRGRGQQRQPARRRAEDVGGEGRHELVLLGVWVPGPDDREYALIFIQLRVLKKY